MIKLVASDVDGTLLNSQEQLSNKTVDALDRLHDSNILFLLASGRAYYETTIVRDRLKHNIGCIGLNGSYYCDQKGQTILSHTLDDEQLEYLFKLGKDNNLDIYFCTDEKSYVYDYPNFVLRSTNAYQKRFNVSWNEAKKLREENFSSPYDTPINQLSEIRGEVLKVAYFFCSDEETKKLEEIIKKNDKLAVSTNTLFNNVEITAKCATKGKMIKEVCDYLHIGYDEVLCFGDGDNDLDMFEYFPNAYAMANSNENVKSVSKHMAPSNDDDGVAFVINKMLEEQKNA